MRRFDLYNADRLVAVGVEFDESGSNVHPVVLLPLGESVPIVAPHGLDSVPMMFAGHAVKVRDEVDEGPAEPKGKRARKAKGS